MGKDAFAYTSSDPNQRGVFLADFSGTEKGRAFEQGKVDWQGAAPDGSKLLIVGTISNEPSAGIWQYDLASSRLQPVVHYSEYPSSLIKRFDSSRVTIKLPSGRSVDCTIFPPANFDRHKKYPLIILDGVWAIDPPWMLAAETCGAYVAVTKRAGWWDGMEQINEHIMGAYQYLIQNTNIDALQVYPCGVSAETRYFNKLVTATPGLWKGVLLIQATQYPDFSSSPPFQTRPKILVTAGGRENKEERLKQFQKDALNQGVVVDYFVYPDDPHVITGNGSRLGRSRDLVHFMFEE
jgi:hypothetical protein